jgi:CheY-like chemotaxis protein
LTFSRQAVVAPRVVDLNAVVLDVERMLARLLGADIDLATRLEPGLWPVFADPGMVEQVLLNLCVNARDAMPRGGRLTVETANVRLGAEYAGAHHGVRPGAYALLAVADTGAGIPPDVLPHVFEPFFTTKPPGKGTGLGLATVHGIVERFGGSVGVYTEAGVGTTFKVYLPRSEEAARGPSGSVPVPPPRGTETVLLVEDDAAVRALAGHLLREAGYTVIEAASGRDALRAADGHGAPVRLLVTDVVLPGMGGRELAARFRAAHPGARVLFMSGYTDDAVVRHGVLAAEAAFLQKPFTAAGLAHKVRETLDDPAG